ncbi:MAG: M55 family metallopeptidase [Lachnospiraceae bacterium]|nr:M55 family metallopeptidase [Lachnospiraceae bacterium]
MKLFISADIEGCAGTTMNYETHKNEPAYQKFAQQMTEEVVAVCEAALEAGVDEIVVKDGHGDATNIDVMAMPEGVTLIRGKSGHPINMMYGLDETFDAVLFIGYHAPAGDPGSPLSHTSTGASNHILLNGARMSEFMLNSYTAAMYGVPVIFLSGDARICELSRELIPSITTVASKHGVGGCAYNIAPQTVIRNLREAVKEMLSGDVQARLEACRLQLPENFTYEVNFKDLKKAYQMSFYPGMEVVDERTDRMSSNRWMDIVTAHSFVVY